MSHSSPTSLPQRRLSLVQAALVSIAATATLQMPLVAQAQAQPQTRPGVSSALQVPPQVQAAPMGADGLLGVALDTIQAIDQGRLAVVWDSASPQLKGAVAQPQFIQSVSQRRREVGALRAREWRLMERLNIRGSATVPDGLYINMAFDAEYAGLPQARDMLTFRLDSDGAWRLAGYTLSQTGSPAR